MKTKLRLGLLSVFGLCLLLCMGLMPIFSLTAKAEKLTTGSGTEDDPYVVDNWDELKSKMAQGGVIRLGHDLWSDDSELSDSDKMLVVPKDKIVKLYMDFKVIDRGLKSQSPVEEGNVILVDGGELYIYNGTVYGGNTTGNGGGIVVNDGKLFLNKVDVVGNKAVGNGGGIFVNNGELYLNDGVVNENKAEGNGGGIYLSSGYFEFNGGEIGNNEADGYGGGIYTAANKNVIKAGLVHRNISGLYGGGVFLGGDNSEFTLQEDNELTQIFFNKAQRGGGLASSGSNSFYILGGLISRNNATGDDNGCFGGGIYSGNGNSIFISGGGITGNTVDDSKSSGNVNGGGIYKEGIGTINISGRPYILDNHKGEEDNNLYLKKGQKINVTGLFESHARIGVITEEKPVLDNSVTITTGYSEYNKDHEPNEFFVDDTRKYLIEENLGEASVAYNFNGGFGLFISGMEVTSDNKDDLTVIDGVTVTKEGGYAKYDDSTNTLKLKDVTINGSNSSDIIGFPVCYYNEYNQFEIEVDGKVVISDCDTETGVPFDRVNDSKGLAFGINKNPNEPKNANSFFIRLAKDSELTVKAGKAVSGSSSSSTGIFSNSIGGLYVRGEGTLTVVSDNAVNSEGIHHNGLFNVDDNAKVDIRTYNDSTDSIVQHASGIYADKIQTILGNILTKVGCASTSAVSLNSDMILIVNGTVEASVNAKANEARALKTSPEFELIEQLAYASINADGSNREIYSSEKNDSYRWVKCWGGVNPPVYEIFDDIDETDWYVKYVQYVFDNRIMTGKGVKFGPNDPVKREEFAQVLYSHSGKPEVNIENPFTDVKDSWYTKSVLWAYKNGIAAGKVKDGNRVFGIGENITREEMALMLYKYAKLKKFNTDRTVGSTEGYKDSEKISSWSKEAMEWAITQGIISGKGGKGAPKSELSLDPQGNATRAECATMVMNLLEKNN